MKNLKWAALLCCLAFVMPVCGQSRPALKLIHQIPMPGVSGRIDHLSIDVRGHRLFVSALGNDTVEVLDLTSDKDVYQITGMSEPQGVFFVAQSNKLFVANGGDGVVKVLDGTNYQLLSMVHFPSDADDIRYDPASRLIFVGYGTGGIGVLNAMTGRELGTVKLRGHAEAFDVENNGARIYVNVPTAGEIAVVDWKQRRVLDRWPMRACQANFPMAFDSVHHRLFVACRRPAGLLVLNPGSGRIMARLPVAGDADDLYYDSARHRIYISGGEGVISVVQQVDANHYRLKATIRTVPGARTSLFVPELNRFYLAVPRRGAQPAEIRVYSVNR